jgi:hypothetical protein
VLLPVRCLSRRADAGAVIGAALEVAAAGAGFRKTAQMLGRPPSTVRGCSPTLSVSVVASSAVSVCATAEGPARGAGRGLVFMVSAGCSF